MLADVRQEQTTDEKKPPLRGGFFELQLAAGARSVSRGYTGVIAS